MRLNQTIRMLATAALVATAGPGLALADSYGAISLSPANGATGWSHSYASRWEAEEAAQGFCYQNAGDCVVAIWFKNACGAVARGPDGGWGSAWAANSRRAQSAAVASCSNHSYNCRVIRWQCSGAR